MYKVYYYANNIMDVTTWTAVLDWILPSLYLSPQFICWSLHSHGDLFGDRAFKEAIKVKWDRKGGALLQ